MNFNQLLVICDRRDYRDAERLGRRILSDWAGGPAPSMRFVEPGDLATMTGDGATVDAAWVYAGPEIDELAVQKVVLMARQWQLPVMLTDANNDSAAGVCWQEGVMVGPPDADPTSLRLILQSLSTQGSTVRDLKSELYLHQKSQTGLVGQIEQLDEELRLASRIQREFLPNELPSPRGVSFEVLYRPAGYVSGDTYDVQQLDDDTVAFYVADAVGHGVPAALLTMLIKQSIRTRERRAENPAIMDPADVLGRLNGDLLRRSGSRVQFVTACYGTLHMPTGTLRLGRAGHPAPMLLKSDGQIVDLEPEGPLLGVFEVAEFDTLTRTLEPGDRLLMYSDGFELAFGSAEKAVDERYIDELHALRAGTCAEAMQRLEAALDGASGSLHQRDDLTALLIDLSAEEDDAATRGVSEERRRRDTATV